MTTAQTGHASPEDARAELAERLLEDATGRLASLGVDGVPHLLLGSDPADLVVELAAERRSSLIAIGTHGRATVGPGLGHVATDIVRSSTSPVMVRRLRA